ncbi:MAG TPA: hypothetical protein VMJ72_01640 [Candidatus Paceibacterota bacterium]|nr:hypothetical protein [Candidatus Paceibacterota bacterium]
MKSHRTIVVIAAAVLACTAGPAHAQGIGPDLLQIPIKTYSLDEVQPTSAAPQCDIAAVVAQTATDPELASVSLSVGTKRQTYVEVRADTLKTYTDYVKDVGVRVLDVDTCTTSVITVTKTYGKAQIDVPVATRHGRVWRTMSEPVAVLKVPAGWDMSVVRRENGIEWNNYNTQFHIASPSGRIVVGLKYPIVNDLPKRGQPRITMVTNVPYSDELAIPSLITRGFDSLAATDANARAALREQGVMSQAFPDLLVADVKALKPEFTTRRIVDEHMDEGEALIDPLWSANRVFVSVGANGPNFAAYTCSGASACGRAQFTAGTYAMVRRRYPDAGLITDFTSAYRDPVNITEAMILLDDMNLKELIGAFGPSIADDPLLEEYLAAAYNTGVTRVIAVLKIARAKHLPEWTDARGRDCHAGTYRQCLLAQTKGYDAKLRYLRDQWTPAQAVAVKP